MYYSWNMNYFFLLFIGMMLFFMIGITLYRHPMKIWKKYSNSSLKKRKAMKRIGLFGMMSLMILYLAPMFFEKTEKSLVSFKAASMPMGKEKKILETMSKKRKRAETISKKEDRQLKTLYQILSQTDLTKACFQNETYQSTSYEAWRDDILTGDAEYVLSLKAEWAADEMGKIADLQEEDRVHDAFDEQFYDLFQKEDGTYEEDYDALPRKIQNKIRNLNWQRKKGVLCAIDEQGVCVNGTAQYRMEESPLFDRLERAGYRGIKRWMQNCEKDSKGIEINAGGKKELFHNTSQYYIFRKKGIIFSYNFKRLEIRFDAKKLYGEAERKVSAERVGIWTLKTDHSGEKLREQVFRSYNDEDVYSKKHCVLVSENNQVMRMILCWEDQTKVRGVSEAEKPFLKACFLKMGISKQEAGQWLESVSMKNNPKSGVLGKWKYRQDDVADTIYDRSKTLIFEK